MFDPKARIVVAGAGSIGCYAGGSLALAGRNVVLLARPAIAAAVLGHGLHLGGLDGAVRRLAPGAVAATADPAAALGGAGIVLVTVKSGATARMADLIAAHASPDAVVVSLQNGVDNADLLRARIGASRQAVAGMVPFNVVADFGVDAAPEVRRTTGGTIRIGNAVAGLAGLLDVAGLPVSACADIRAVQWGKLLLNLNNALNALSGLPLARQLSDRRWRLLLAGQIAEALAVLRRAGIRPAAIEGLPPALLPHLLRLPDFIFTRLARRMLAVGADAGSSMADDLRLGRLTEIDQLQGAIIALADTTGGDAPLARRIVALVRRAERAGAGSPGLSPDDIGGG